LLPRHYQVAGFQAVMAANAKEALDSQSSVSAVLQ
jgi:hypothetical protein